MATIITTGLALLLMSQPNYDSLANSLRVLEICLETPSRCIIDYTPRVHIDDTLPPHMQGADDIPTFYYMLANNNPTYQTPSSASSDVSFYYS